MSKLISSPSIWQSGMRQNKRLLNIFGGPESPLSTKACFFKSGRVNKDFYIALILRHKDIVLEKPSTLLAVMAPDSALGVWPTANMS